MPVVCVPLPLILFLCFSKGRVYVPFHLPTNRSSGYVPNRANPRPPECHVTLGRGAVAPSQVLRSQRLIGWDWLVPSAAVHREVEAEYGVGQDE